MGWCKIGGPYMAAMRRKWKDMEDEDDDSATDDSDYEDSDYVPNGAINGHVENSTSRMDAKCENCGRMGVRDAFYSKSKRFCRNNVSKTQHSKPGKKKCVKKFTQGFTWSDYFSNVVNTKAAPVSCFKHCAMSESWDNIKTDMKVEVPNTDANASSEVFWVASIVRICGYYVQLRFEGFGLDDSHDFWINLGSKDVHPVGWCATNRRHLVPPITIQSKYSDWREFLIRRLTGAKTIPCTFKDTLTSGIHHTRLRVGLGVEVVDKMCVSAMRVAQVTTVIGGRLHLQYADTHMEDEGFWCHELSPLLHPVGWSESIGHNLHALPRYRVSSLEKSKSGQYDPDDATPEMFRKRPAEVLCRNGGFRVGMKLEAIDPLNLSTICVATVQKVLAHDFLMIGIEGSPASNGSDWFCYHASSPCIFPAGFCELHDIPLTPPRNYVGSFTWRDFLRQSGSQAAPVHLFAKGVTSHGFEPGQKLEAVDLMEPRLICIATVARVVGRLLRVHFDGWEDNYDQWVDSASADLYPVGWCELVGHRLEGPYSTEYGKPALQKKRRTSKGRQRKKRRSSSYKINGATDSDRCSPELHCMTSPATPSSPPPAASHSIAVLSTSSGPSHSNTPAKSNDVHQLRVPSQRHVRLWEVAEVCEFLGANDCAQYCEAFQRQGINGRVFLTLTKEQMVTLTGMRVGPSLRIYDLIQQLKMRMMSELQR